MDQLYVAAQIAEITRQVEGIKAGRRAVAATSGQKTMRLAPLDAATLTKKQGLSENPFNAAQSTRVG